MEKKRYMDGDRLHFRNRSISWNNANAHLRMFFPIFALLSYLVFCILYFDQALVNMGAIVITWFFISSLFSVAAISFMISVFICDCISEYYSRKANNDL